MDDEARTAAEYRVELVLPGDREALVAPGLVAGKPVTVVPAPGSLTDIARERTDISDLERRHVFRGLGQHREPLADNGLFAKRPEGGQAPYRDAVSTSGNDLIDTFHGLEIDEDIRHAGSRPVHDPLLHELQEIRPSGGERDGPAVLSSRLRERHRLIQGTRVLVCESFHASAPRILSRVMGRSFIRSPVALKIALATAGGAIMMPDSPTVFAPKGPRPSSVSMKVTSIFGAST